MHELVSGGMSEREALKEVFSNDSNRSRKLKLWKTKGLWPIPETEGNGPSAEEFYESRKQSNDVEPAGTARKAAESSSAEDVTLVEQLKEALRSPEVTEHFKSLAKEVYQDMAPPIRTEPPRAESSHTIPLDADGYPVLCPPPRMDGKRCVNPRIKIGGTVLDGRLAELLNDHRKARGVNLSRIFDTAIWYFLGQPALSDQEEIMLHDSEEGNE